MKTSIKRIICSLLCVCFIAGVFSACSGNKKLIDFIYPFSADVKSYDPQVASTSDEFLIIENTFEGLIRIDDDGTVKKGAAQSWSISEDKLTYTFNLKKGLKWDINTEKYKEGDKKGKFKDSRLDMLGYEFNPDITANDFVFALRRAVDPRTKCPLFSSFSSIEKAVEINSGKAKPEALGVTAKDDYTLIIKLSSPDEAFMQALTSAAAMPCNEEFFNATKGRYGLSTKYTLFNGQFYVNQILESSYLLKQNEYYKGDYPAFASELTLKIPDENDSTVDRLMSGYYDAAFISGRETEQLKNASKITFTPYNDTTLAFVFNTKGEIFQSKTMRQAFCFGFSRSDKTEKDYLLSARNLIPSSCTIEANNACEAIGATVKNQDKNKSIELWKKGLKIIGKDEITVTVLTTEALQNSVKQLLQGIQGGIGTITKSSDGDPITFTLKVKAVKDEEMRTSIAKGEYDLAFCSFKSNSNSAVSFLRNSFEEKAGFDNSKFKKALSNAEKAGTLSEKAKYIEEAENVIINSYSIWPMLYETSYYAEAEGVHDIQFHAGTGRVNFTNAKRN